MGALYIGGFSKVLVDFVDWLVNFSVDFSVRVPRRLPLGGLLTCW